MTPDQRLSDMDRQRFEAYVQQAFDSLRVDLRAALDIGDEGTPTLASAFAHLGAAQAAFTKHVNQRSSANGERNDNN